ncbi:MAG: hypothetical protein GY842_11765 [bacterium]|nr:hypothetical protein [bacterium]
MRLRECTENGDLPATLPAQGVSLMKPRRRSLVLGLSVAVTLSVGCGGDARVELSAADSIDALAGALEQAVREYHGEVVLSDEVRESGAITAFVRRIRESTDDPTEQDRHAAEFTAALARLRDDRAVEWSRFGATLDNLETLRETVGGLRRLAIESLTLSDEARRYVHTWIDRLRAQRRVSPNEDSTTVAEVR